MPLVSCADNVLLPLRYAPFQQHIVFSLLFFLFLLGLTSLTNVHHIIDKCTSTAKNHISADRLIRADVI